MATKKAKPNGQFYLKGEDVMDFMKDQSVQNIPGINLSSDNCHSYNWILYCFIKITFIRKVSQKHWFKNILYKCKIMSIFNCIF